MSTRRIHPTAIVHPSATLGERVTIGPFCIIDPDVELGDDCVLGPHVYLTGRTRISSNNRFHAGCVIGDAPQDLKYKNGPSRVVIGKGNVFREHVTVHRSTSEEGCTVIGDGNFLMANSHVAHNCEIGSSVILANGALLAGHVVIHDRAFISGNCLVHQNCRVGRLALMQGGSAISKDLPPFCIARGDNGICGLNIVGLRRNGISDQDRLDLRRVYHLLFRTNRRITEVIRDIATDYPESPLVQELATFIKASKRGLCSDVGKRGDDHAESP